MMGFLGAWKSAKAASERGDIAHGRVDLQACIVGDGANDWKRIIRQRTK